MSGQQTPTPAAKNDLWRRSTYQPGDGDVVSATRPGSLDALKLPSLYGQERRYRDGRTEGSNV